MTKSGGKGLDKGATVGALGALATAKTMFDVLREVSFDYIRDEATRTPRVLVLAESDAEADAIARLLTGSETLVGVGLGTLATPVADPAGYDAIVVRDNAGGQVAQRLRERWADPDRPSAVFEVAEGPFTKVEADGLRGAIACLIGDRGLAFARRYPAFRPDVVAEIVQDTAMANAQFALLANLPSLIPVLGGLASASADMIVMTKNQLMMVYKIAAAHGRNLDDQVGIVREMAPVVGTGFVWRTVAREATSFVPFAAGTVPKIAIAFTGTYAAGRAADFFYRYGYKPNRPQRAEFYQQARAALGRVTFRRKGTAAPEAVVDGAGLVPTPPAAAAVVEPQAS
jgi:uncharacterized protein (DUF697 family)